MALEKRPRLDSWQGPRRAGAVVPFFRADTIERNPLIEILLDEHDRIDWALKKFRRQMLRSGRFKDMKRKRFYVKPSEARKVKEKAAERRRHKDRKRAARRADL